MVGNPANLMIGSKIESDNDYSDWLDLLGFSRFYSSVNASGGSLGARWRHSFDISISPADDGALRLNRPSGNGYIFHELDGYWVSDVDVRFRLKEMLGNENQYAWEVYGPNNQIERFDNMGRLVRIIKVDGSSVVLSYDYDGNLSSVRDRRGRQLVFSYNNGILTSVTRPDGRVINYFYEGGVLSEVRYSVSDGYESILYLYEDPSDPFLLTGVIDEKGQRYATWKYDSVGRVVESRHGDSDSDIDKVTLHYGTNQTLVIYPLGNAVNYDYTVALGRAKLTGSDKACVSCGGNYRSRSYDSNGYPDRHVDFNGKVTDYDYNIDGQQVRSIEAQGTASERTFEQEWHENFNVLLERRTYNSLGALIHETSWVRNARGQPLTRTETDPGTSASRTTTFQYCEQPDVTGGACPLVGLLTEVHGPRQTVNDITTYEYYPEDHAGCGSGECLHRKGDLHTMTNGLGQVTEFLAYDGTGRPIRIADTNGVVTEFEYDARDRLISHTAVAGLPEEAVTRMSYDATGQVTKITSPAGAWVTFEYDVAHRLRALEDAVGNRIEYTLDAAGNRVETQVFGPGGAMFREGVREYDRLSRLIAKVNGMGDRTEHTYDPAGNLTETEDGAFQVTAFGYDVLNRLINVTDALNGEITYKYDGLDNRTEVIDPRGVTTTYDYDAFGDVIAEHSPDAGTTIYTYYAAGNRLTRTDARGVIASYSYDALNRLTGIDYPGTKEDVTYVYDQGAYGTGRSTGFNDASGSTTMTYDPRGNVLTRTHTRTAGPSFITEYEYDLADNLTAMLYPSGLRIDLTRDTMGRVTSVDATNDGQDIQLVGQIQYQPFGGITGLTYGNSLTEIRQYDLAGRLTRQSALPIQDLDWAYDPVGNITEIQDGVTPARTQTFDYDALNRLTSASGAYGVRAYEYDAVGNRTRLTKDGQETTYSYAPDSNRLTDIDGQTVPYDATGNMLTLAGDTFTYGARNRRQTTERNQSLIAEYEYNALGQRSYKNHAGAETHFVYGQDGQLIGEYDATGQVIREYVYLAGEPMALVRQGEVYYFHNDQLGSPLKLTDGNQNIVWDGLKTPFGEIMSATGSVDNSLRFPGQYFDSETGLHQNWFRDYDPVSGRYTQSDPIGIRGGVNLYGYVEQNPISNYDILGLYTWALPRPIFGGRPMPGAWPRPMPNPVDLFPPYQEQRKRGKTDPVIERPYNPGRDCDGNCKPCKASSYWEASGDAHGSEGGSHWHGIEWNQDKSDCMCYPKRVDYPYPPIV